MSQNKQATQQNEVIENQQTKKPQDQTGQQGNAKQQESPRKTLHKIKQRRQMPSDKTQLIEYLSERIQEAEEALNDTEQLLDSEVSEREKVSKSIDERNKQLEKLYEVDQKGLPDKIKGKLTEILTQTVNQKIQAEEQLNEEKGKITSIRRGKLLCDMNLRIYRYNELKHDESQSKAKLDSLAEKENAFNDDITKITKSIEVDEIELKDIEEEFESAKEKKEELENKYLQMKVALQRMTDTKAVLNRFFSNEDLFDEKMDLKEQKVVIPFVNDTQGLPSKVDSRLPSRENRNITKLKPLTNSRKRDNADDDFWKGDFTSTKNNRNF